MPLRTPLSVLLACAAVLVCAAPAAALAPFQLGIHEPGAAGGNGGYFDRLEDADAQIARATVTWAGVAPTRPANPRNPADPKYNWTSVDAFVRAAKSRGIEPLITTYWAPGWAEGDNAADRTRRTGQQGAYHPNAAHYGDFMRALATRYSGSFADPASPGRKLPRVRYFQMWNEPNFGQYLLSQTQAEIPRYYVRLLNAGYDAVKAVSRSNFVLTAGMGPYGNNGHATDVDPQVFMREMLCLTGEGGRKLRVRRRCDVPKPKFDAWTQHPYTFGGHPRTKGRSIDAAAIGNMADIKRTLDFAVRKRTTGTRGRKPMWVTEFGWFSNPPGIVSGDGRQLGSPLSTQAAYLSETAYRLWKLGFRAMVWYGWHDQRAFPAGLALGENLRAKPKPSLTAFRFPFYADHSKRRVLVWGIARGRERARVRIERRVGRRWRSAATIGTDERGMFHRRVRGPRGTYRARVTSSGATSRPFRAR